MRDQSVGRFFADCLPYARQSLRVVVLSGGGGDLLDVRREGGERRVDVLGKWVGSRRRRNDRREGRAPD